MQEWGSSEGCSSLELPQDHQGNLFSIYGKCNFLFPISCCHLVENTEKYCGIYTVYLPWLLKRWANVGVQILDKFEFKFDSLSLILSLM
jgi:hypothetical protein